MLGLNKEKRLLDLLIGGEVDLLFDAINLIVESMVFIKDVPEVVVKGLWGHRRRIASQDERRTAVDPEIGLALAQFEPRGFSVGACGRSSRDNPREQRSQQRDQPKAEFHTVSPTRVTLFPVASFVFCDTGGSYFDG